ncbi:MAG: hypothetical protein WA816_06835 [Bacteroidales bacterium]
MAQSFPISVSKHLRLVFILLILFPVSMAGQDTIPARWSLNGYITNMQSFMFQRLIDNWTIDNLIHNRLNFRWDSKTDNFKAVLEMRNRLIIGESVSTIPGYAKMIDTDNGFFKLSDNLSKGNSYLLNSKIDRVYIDYTKNKFQLTIGRQRINWGQCFTWNPNDLFNAYSFFDFDYVEKPGSDAIRLQYYTSNTSAFEFAVKADNNKKVTSAFLYHFNKWNYDIQFLGGILNEQDFVIGTGWSGNIKGASFRGEISYFQPKHNFADTTGILVVSLGTDYTFKNSFTLQFEVLYNQNRSSGVTNFVDFYNESLSAKNLSFTKVTFMLQGSYPITPLLNVSLAGMYFPKLNGLFLGPSFTYSLTNNIDFSIISQSFAGQLVKGQTEHFNFGFLRLKWNF